MAQTLDKKLLSTALRRADDSEQWSSIGLTSVMYWSIGLIPFKDDFWSETMEPGNHWGEPLQPNAFC
jgi:hypothetical protein